MCKPCRMERTIAVVRPDLSNSLDLSALASLQQRLLHDGEDSRAMEDASTPQSKASRIAFAAFERAAPMTLIRG